MRKNQIAKLCIIKPQKKLFIGWAIKKWGGGVRPYNGPAINKLLSFAASNSIREGGKNRFFADTAKISFFFNVFRYAYQMIQNNISF